MSVDIAYCRLCAALKTLDNLIDLKYDEKKRQEIVEKLTRIYPGIDFTKDSLPTTVCAVCTSALDKVFDFVIGIEQAQTTLRDRIVLKIKTEESETGFSDGDYILFVSDDDFVYEPPEFIDENEELTTHLEDNFRSKTLVPTDTVKKEIVPQEDYVLDNDTNLGNDTSWTGYKWFCLHCKIECENMDSLRVHSKEHHNVCFAYKCIDCAEKLRFNTFNAFIEHVRLHREVLRYYCQYCNTKFKSKEQCIEHTLTHWEGPQKICSQCGEICIDLEGLEQHRKVYRKSKLPKSHPNVKPLIVELNAEDEKSWTDYEWACQECFLKLPDVSALRQHAQTIHNKCFAFKCADCLRVMRHYRSFTAHVTTHRPYLAKYCQYCNMHIEDSDRLQQHIDDHFNGPQRPCHGCGQIFPDNHQVSQHMKNFNSPRFISVLTTEDLTCDICSKVSKNIVAFRAHRKTHSAKKFTYTCETCGKAFYRKYKFNDHIKTHSVQKEICPVCNKKYYTKTQLKAHIATHTDARPFICNDCGNSYRTKQQLYLHLIIHRDVKKYKCSFCGREFNFKDNLRTHKFQHTGSRPYSCPSCDRTFTNPGNRKKHMVRCRGVSSAKVTPGRLDVKRESVETNKSMSDSNATAKEWFSENSGMKRGKKNGLKKGK